MPAFFTFFKPLLTLAAEGEVNVRESANRIADDFRLSDQARLESTRSGNQRKYIDRTHWAATYLRQARLIVTTKRGFVQITEDGTKFLAAHVGDISFKDLRKIPAFTEFQHRRGTRSSTIENKDHDEDQDILTPFEKIDAIITEIEDNLAADLLDQLQKSSPSFFEKVVVDVLSSMGYGFDESAGKVIGKPGDDGVDGLINQDVLGLERVYFQAKRYQSDNTISSEAIRSFTGALNVQQAQKGLFVTTSTFSKRAIETAEKVPQRMVLIDGKRLSQLMIKYNVGCVTLQTQAVKQLDQEYFE